MRRFLNSIESQTKLPDEVVVVDGGSDDGTVEILESWSAQTSVAVRVVVEPGANISVGRNIAIDSALHPLIAVTDAGTTLDPGWLESLAELAKPEIGVVSGFFDPEGDTFLGRAIAAAVMPTLGEIDASNFLPSSRSVMFRKSIWEQVGGYPEWLDYCEDLVFDLAMKDAGGNFAFASDARVTWNARPDLKSYAKQYFRYARGDGKANLWLKRHVARYVAYGVGSAFLLLGVLDPRWLLVDLVGGAIHLRKFAYRVSTRRSTFRSPFEWLAAIGLVPIVVAIGDISKMVGYPRGVSWRASRRLPAGVSFK